MKPLSDKTAGFTDSVIRRMTRISNQYGAINLSQGFPDFDPPKEITDKLAELAPNRTSSVCNDMGIADNSRSTCQKTETFLRNGCRSRSGDCSDMWWNGSDDGSNAYCV